MMKTLLVATLFGIAATTSAFAQSTAQQPVAQPSATGTTTVSQPGQWVPPYGQAIAPKTRAQVYQELVQAENDGQLAYLNSTLYSHH
jgi:hypothetical protein